MTDKQPKTVYGDPVTAVHVIFPVKRWQCIAIWSDVYKAYVVSQEDLTVWTPESARRWHP